MYASPPPVPGHHHQPTGIHQHYRPYYGPGYVTPGYGGTLSCVEIPNPAAAAVPPYVWVNPLTGAACAPYLPFPGVL